MGIFPEGVECYARQFEIRSPLPQTRPTAFSNFLKTFLQSAVSN
jgi:hypothetical protein